MRSEGYCSGVTWVCQCLSVCLLMNISSSLTMWWRSVRYPESDITSWTGNESQKIFCGLPMNPLHWRDTPLPAFYDYRTVSHLETAHAPFQLRVRFFGNARGWRRGTIMPPCNVCCHYYVPKPHLVVSMCTWFNLLPALHFIQFPNLLLLLILLPLNLIHKLVEHQSPSCVKLLWIHKLTRWDPFHCYGVDLE